jgi:hypothetical protein
MLHGPRECRDQYYSIAVQGRIRGGRPRGIRHHFHGTTDPSLASGSRKPSLLIHDNVASHIAL